MHGRRGCRRRATAGSTAAVTTAPAGLAALGRRRRAAEDLKNLPQLSPLRRRQCPSSAGGAGAVACGQVAGEEAQLLRAGAIDLYPKKRSGTANFVAHGNETGVGAYSALETM